MPDADVFEPVLSPEGLHRIYAFSPNGWHAVVFVINIRIQPGLGSKLIDHFNILRSVFTNYIVREFQYESMLDTLLESYRVCLPPHVRGNAGSEHERLSLLI